MTELLTKAFEEAAKLPQDIQNQMARRFLSELQPYRQTNRTLRSDAMSSGKPQLELRALVGLIDEPLDVDTYLEEVRGPAWERKLDGPA